MVRSRWSSGHARALDCAVGFHPSPQTKHGHFTSACVFDVSFNQPDSAPAAIKLFLALAQFQAQEF